MSRILKQIGLSRDDVERMLGTRPTKHRYLFGPRQAVIRRRLKENATWLVSQFLSGEHPRYIAAALGVSEESVRRRLRGHDLFGTGGRKGRPVRPC